MSFGGGYEKPVDSLRTRGIAGAIAGQVFLSGVRRSDDDRARKRRSENPRRRLRLLARTVRLRKNDFAETLRWFPEADERLRPISGTRACRQHSADCHDLSGAQSLSLVERGEERVVRTAHGGKAEGADQSPDRKSAQDRAAFPTPPHGSA